MSMDGITIDAGDITSERAILAVQGPQARSLLTNVDEAIASVERFDVRRLEWQGVPIVVAGTGYTGEDGVEIAVPASHASALWSALTSAGITPAGLGARDTLRLEAGLPLHGHELGEGITSLQAGLGWAVRFDKGPFRGSEALAAERDRGISRRLAGLVTEGRRPPREGSAVLRDGVVVGEVTSGNFSPELGHGIALAFLPPDASVGDQFAIDVRGTFLDAVVVKPPFVG
jgi:aminomethyltransferase